MPKYLFQGSYTEKGLSGLLKEGGSKRRDAAEQVIKSVGGTQEAFYFAFGDNDFYVIADMPDNVSTSAASLIVNASGAVKVKTIVLLTPEEVDQSPKSHEEKQFLSPVMKVIGSSCRVVVQYGIDRKHDLTSIRI